jgi:hypothetical protein
MVVSRTGSRVFAVDLRMKHCDVGGYNVLKRSTSRTAAGAGGQVHPREHDLRRRYAQMGRLRLPPGRLQTGAPSRARQHASRVDRNAC